MGTNSTAGTQCYRKTGSYIRLGIYIQTTALCCQSRRALDRPNSINFFLQNILTYSIPHSYEKDKRQMEKHMNVIKRDGTRQTVSFDKITDRITNLCNGIDTNFVNIIAIAQKVIAGIYPDITTTEL